MDTLIEYLRPDDKEERVGFILNDGSVIELENVAQDRARNFSVRPEDMVAYKGRAVATWHTHPEGTSAPSSKDVEAFLQWPRLVHWIVSPRGVSGYRVDKGALLCVSR